jgi:hypothetical protein
MAGIWRDLTAPLLLLLLCAGAFGGCGRQEGAVEVDLTTPRSAATVFTRALEAGDVETAKSAAYGGGLEIEWVEAMAQAMPGMRRLVAAAEVKFGDEAHSLVAGKQTLNLSGTLADAEVQMNGERATVIPVGGDGTKFPMKRIDGKWKIDVGLLTRGEDISDIVKQLRVVGQVAPQLTKDVEAGKFKTAQALRREMSRSVAQAFGASLPPTTNESLPPPVEESF